MNLSVKFDGKELGEYIDILQGFTPFVGPSWEPNVISRGDVTKGDDFSYTTYKAKTIPMPPKKLRGMLMTSADRKSTRLNSSH